MLRLNHSVHQQWTRWLVSIALNACVLITPAYSEETPSYGGFRRGIGIGDELGWAPKEPAPSSAFVFPPFNQSTGPLGNELKALKQAGFDHVRLAVDPGPFLQFQESRRDLLDEILMDRVKLILASQLSVIVDFHPSDIHEDYTSNALTRGVDTPLFQAYLGLLVRTAALLDQLQSSRVALEIMNEPPVTSTRWQPMLEAAYKAVRSRAPHLLLVLDGGDEGSSDGMMTLAPGAFRIDSAALISFHYYDPYQFTHQGASWTAARYLADVPYPALARPVQDSLDATAASVATSNLSSSQKSVVLLDAQQRIESYRSSSFDRSTIARRFDRIAVWARNQGVPRNRIILGEFGAGRQNGRLRGARNAERARWIGDVREQAEAHQFNWAVWVYRGSGGFSLGRDEESSELDPAIIEALGLNRQ
jgi:endoglucanase